MIQSTGNRIVDNGDLTFEELAAKKSHLSPRVYGFLDRTKQSLHAFSTVYDTKGEAIALLCAALFCDSMENIFGNTHYGEDAFISIVDRKDGNILFDRSFTSRR